ncbi:MAG: hypothetical protein GY861_15235 [bacterium]|nr:hypothetical protein [bacterium]
MKAIFATILLAAALIGCTDAKRSKLFNLGDSAKITCFSGGIVIYKGESTGKISSEANSDGYYFREKGSNRLMEVSGNCVIVYED